MAIEPLAVLNAAKTGVGLFRDLFPKSREKEHEEQTFAREFLKQVRDDPEMHPHCKKLGLQRIARARNSSAEAIEYVLNLQEPLDAVAMLRSGELMLKHDPAEPSRQLVFREPYADQTERRRVTRRYAWGALASLVAVFAAPLWLRVWRDMAAWKGEQPLFDLGLVLLVIESFAMPLAWLSARELMKRLNAEALVNLQKPYPQKPKPPVPSRLPPS